MLFYVTNRLNIVETNFMAFFSLNVNFMTSPTVCVFLYQRIIGLGFQWPNYKERTNKLVLLDWNYVTCQYV